MKNLILAVFIILGLSIVSSNAGEKAKLHFKNGGHISGVIVDSVPGVSLKIKSDDFNEKTYNRSKITKNEYNSSLIKTKGIYGFGLGIHYGVLGVGLELNAPFGNSSAFIGIGTTVFDGLGWGIGARFYPVNFQNKFQPRISVVYGTNSVLVLSKDGTMNLSADKEYEVGTGVNVGAGLKWMFGETHSWGMDFDLYYVASSSLEDRIDELNNEGYNIKGDLPKFDIAVGFIFAF